MQGSEVSSSRIEWVAIEPGYVFGQFGIDSCLDAGRVGLHGDRGGFHGYALAHVAGAEGGVDGDIGLRLNPDVVLDEAAKTDGFDRQRVRSRIDVIETVQTYFD